MKNTHLSQRESQVLRLIADEYTNQERAARLYLSYYTINDYRKSLMVKLSARNTAGLIRRAFELGLLQLSQSLPASEMTRLYIKPTTPTIMNHTFRNIH